MKTSARNQLLGKISAIQIGAVNAEVNLILNNGETITASITKESVEKLAIKPDMTVMAWVEAAQIMLVSDFGDYQISARNQLTGTIVALNSNTISAEVVISLASGDTLAAAISADSVETLGLRKGQTVSAVFKAGAVILAVPD
ncbi:MAG: molybdopterin-binding protein [Methylomonas sp.]